MRAHPQPQRTPATSGSSSVVAAVARKSTPRGLNDKHPRWWVVVPPRLSK